MLCSIQYLVTLTVPLILVSIAGIGFSSILTELLSAAAKTIAAWNYVVDAAANDNFELVWQTTDANIQLINAAASGNVPDIPSIILTVTQVR